MRTAVSFLMLCLLTAQGYAQLKNKPHNYTTEEGLSENVVYAMFQDREGFLWAGTHHGLNRFDGYAWKTFYHSNYDSTSIPANVIYDIKELGDDLFISSTAGVFRFSKKTFRSKLIPTGDPTLTAGSYQMEKLNDSLIAVSFLDKVGLLNASTGTISILNTGNRNNSVIIGLHRFFHDVSGKTYFAGGNATGNTLFRIDTESKTVEPVDQKLLFPFNPEGPVKDYFIDELKHHWAYYENKGWKVYDHTGRPDEIKLVNAPTNISTSAHIAVNEKVWLASNIGVVCYNMNSRTSELINNSSNNILVNKVYSLIMDRQHNIWVGTFGGGISKLAANPAIGNYGYQNQPDILLGNMVTGIRKLRSGKLLLYDFTNYEIRDEQFRKIESGTIKNELGQLVKLGLDMNEEQARNSELQLKTLSADGDLPFHTVTTDAKGRIYHNGRAITKDGKSITAPSGTITKTVTDKWDNTWIASTSGLYKMLPDNSLRGIAFRGYRNVPSFIFVDALITGDSTLWLATQEGLIKMQLPRMSYKRYNVDLGLPDNYIYQIQSDRKGNIWLSTNRGISCLVISENKFRNFGKRYGLINSEYNSYSSVKLNDTTLIFGGTAGIDFINPEKLLPSANLAPEVLLTGIKINNTDTIPVRNMSVPYGKNNWEFSFTTNDFDFPQEIYFRYRLLGASDQWLYSQGNNRTLFSILKPGNYTFEVQASYNRSEWSRAQLFPFQITRPFWQSWWFIIMALSIVSIVVFWLFKYRLQQKVNLLNMRNRISRDLHDDVGSSLSGIRIFSQMAEEKIDSDPVLARSYMQKVLTYCEGVLGSMNDIVWTINPDNDSFIKIYRKLHSYAASVAEPYRVKVNFSEAGLLNNQRFNMEDRKNLYLIAKEAINNAIKYSGCKNLKVDIRKIRDQLIMEICDDGKGFDPSTSLHGNGLRNMSERAQEMNANFDFKTNSEGTTIKVTLRVPRIG